MTDPTDYALTALALFKAADTVGFGERQDLFARARRLAIRAADLIEHDQPEDAP